MQAADLLTKPLDRKRFVSLRRYLMNTDAMVEAPLEDTAAHARAAGSVNGSSGGDTAADDKSDINDRDRHGADHGGVSMPDCSARPIGST